MIFKTIIVATPMSTNKGNINNIQVGGGTTYDSGSRRPGGKFQISKINPAIGTSVHLSYFQKSLAYAEKETLPFDSLRVDLHRGSLPSELPYNENSFYIELKRTF